MSLYSRASQTVVLVTVTDIGISAPSFPASTVNIVVSEGVLSGASVWQGDAIDPDGDALTYSMSQITTFQNNPDFVISSRYDTDQKTSTCLVKIIKTFTC